MKFPRATRQKRRLDRRPASSWSTPTSGLFAGPSRLAFGPTSDITGLFDALIPMTKSALEHRVRAPSASWKSLLKWRRYHVAPMPH
jgi:hypothetical protein